MGTVKTWSTKEEVLKDIPRASGKRSKNQDIDESYLVIGDAPPPILVEDEDDQMALLFGDAVKKNESAEGMAPDLMGIQQMLKMVKDYDSGDNEDDTGTNVVSETSDCVIKISKVSKLNPNVKEFTPKLFSSSRNCINNKDISNNINANVVTQSEVVNVEDSSEKNTAAHVDVKCNDSSLNVDDKEDKEYTNIVTQLKNQISDAAKSDSFEIKKQKNVAIATLLKLYASNNNKPVKNTKEPIKLITPEYFEGKNDDHLKVKTDVKIAPQTISTGTSTSSTPEPKNSTTTIPSCSSHSITSTPLHMSSENNINENCNKEKTKLKIDPEIKNSIEKVNRWLGEPTKSPRKSPAVCVGPIAFKRKEPDCSKSPVSDPEQKDKRSSKTSSTGQRYQPSNYAADLGRKYMERNKVKENEKKLLNWSNLDEILKEKDVMIKKQADEQASASESNDDTVVPRT